MTLATEALISEKETIEMFVRSLFPDMQGEFIEQRSISANKIVTQHFYPSVESLITDWEQIRLKAGHENIYFGVCARSERKGTKEAVRSLHCLYVDLDFKTFQGGESEARELLGKFPLQPTIIVHSGHGLHLYWVLKSKQVIADPSDVSRFESYLKGLATTLKGDLASAELARVLRLPCTLNHKDEKAATVTIEKMEVQRKFDLHDFDPFLITSPSNNLIRKANGWISDALNGLGKESHTRNLTFCSIAGRLHRGHWSNEDILNLLTPHAEKCEFDREELEGIIGRVSKYPAPEMNRNDSAHPRELVPCGVKFNPKSLFQVMNEKPPVREWLVENYLAKSCLAILAGHPKHGKSTLVYWLVKCVLVGKPFLGFTTKRVNVLILAVEECIEDITDRFSKSDTTENVGLYIHCAPLKSTSVELEGIREFIKTKEIGLVIVDTLARFWTVKDEGNASEVSAATQPLLELARETGAVVLLIHHSRKSEGEDGTEIRGSGDILAVADIGLILKKRKGSENQRVLHAHSRYSTPKELIISLEDGGYSVLGSENKVRQEEQRAKVLACLNNEYKDAEGIATKADIAPGTCRTVLNTLYGEGLVARQGAGTKGKAYLYALKSENDSAQNQSLGVCAINQSRKNPAPIESTLPQIQTVFPGAKVVLP